MTTFKPLADRVLVEPTLQPEGDILIPDPAREETNEGTIIAVAPGCKEVKAGDAVLYNKHAGVKTRFGLVMRESDVFGRII